MQDRGRCLTDLLRHRERLAATMHADAWAMQEAMPSQGPGKVVMVSVLGGSE